MPEDPGIEDGEVEDFNREVIRSIASVIPSDRRAGALERFRRAEEAEREAIRQAVDVDLAAEGLPPRDGERQPLHVWSED